MDPHLPPCLWTHAETGHTHQRVHALVPRAPRPAIHEQHHRVAAARIAREMDVEPVPPRMVRAAEVTDQSIAAVRRLDAPLKCLAINLGPLGGTPQ